jgi:hypothetical protein
MEPFNGRGGTITADGRPVHGRWLEDARPTMPNGVLRVIATREPDPDHWSISLTAIGDEPWEIGVEMWADRFPLKEDDAYIKARYEIPRSNDMAGAIVRAVALRDKLNARGLNG